MLSLQKPYTVYYLEDKEPDLEVFFKRAHRQTVTDASTIQISRLYACERYFFHVGCGPDSCPISDASVISTQEGKGTTGTSRGKPCSWRDDSEVFHFKNSDIARISHFTEQTCRCVQNQVNVMNGGWNKAKSMDSEAQGHDGKRKPAVKY